MAARRTNDIRMGVWVVFEGETEYIRHCFHRRRLGGTAQGADGMLDRISRRCRGYRQT
jgi:hypothetical protein